MTDDNSDGPGLDATLAKSAAEVVSSVASATADAVSKVHGKFQLMFQRGYGITLFGAGFVAVVAAIVLRIDRPDEVSTGVFVRDPRVGNDAAAHGVRLLLHRRQVAGNNA